MAACYLVQANIAHVAIGAGRDHVRLGANLQALPLWAVKLVCAAAGATLGLPTEGGAAVLVIVVLGLVVWRRAARPVSRFLTPRALGLLVVLGAVVLLTGAARAA